MRQRTTEKVAAKKATAPPDWGKTHAAMEARLRALLAKHHPTAPSVGMGLEDCSARDRIRTLALVAAACTNMDARGWGYDRILEAVESGYDGEKAATADTRAIERGKMLLIRLVWRGCHRRGGLR